MPRSTHAPSVRPVRRPGLLQWGLVWAVLALLAGACADPPAGTAGEGDAEGGGEDGTTQATAPQDQDLTPVGLQLGWIGSGNQLGEVVAKNQGFYEEEGIDLTIEPGGPHIDGVALVASGQSMIGQVSSSPSLMLAVSEGVPVKTVAVGAQEHPYAYFSMPDDPISAPDEMVGKTIGTQATGEILLDALLAVHDIDKSDLDVHIVGSEITPLLAGQVDAFTGWLTNTTQLNELPEDYEVMRMWDVGVQLYALPYYVTDQTIEQNPEIVEGFLRATAKGWAYARDNVEESVDMLVEEYPDLNREDELEAADVMLDFVFTESSAQDGWGAMDPAVWEEQLRLWDELDQFAGEAPTVDDVVTMQFLEATADARDVG